MRWALLFVMSVPLIACSTSRDRHSPADPAYTVESPYVATAPSDSCIALWSECDSAGKPCCEGFCGMTGYGMAQCVPLAVVGEMCMADVECVTGLCREGACASASTTGECLAVGASCAFGTSGTCCAGHYCSPYSYLPDSQTCQPLVELGGACEADSNCQTGHCPDGICRGECLAMNAECFADGECCGRFCTFSSDSYVPGACSTPLPAGSACHYDGWCASRSCLEGVCQ